jgi:hypothetical protein
MPKTSLPASDAYAEEVVRQLIDNGIIEVLPGGQAVKLDRQGFVELLSFAHRAGAEHQRKTMIARIEEEFPEMKPH